MFDSLPQPLFLFFFFPRPAPSPFRTSPLPEPIRSPYGRPGWHGHRSTSNRAGQDTEGLVSTDRRKLDSNSRHTNTHSPLPLAEKQQIFFIMNLKVACKKRDRSQTDEGQFWPWRITISIIISTMAMAKKLPTLTAPPTARSYYLVDCSTHRSYAPAKSSQCRSIFHSCSFETKHPLHPGNARSKSAGGLPNLR